MGKLTDFVKEYFATTPSEQLRQDWEELKAYNSQGPDILDVIGNYQTELPDNFGERIHLPNNLTSTFTDTELCLSA